MIRKTIQNLISRFPWNQEICKDFKLWYITGDNSLNDTPNPSQAPGSYEIASDTSPKILQFQTINCNKNKCYLDPLNLILKEGYFD